MPALSIAPHLLTLSDVAALAHVQRPVVSMWRRRAAGTALPFPEPAARHDGRDAFHVDDVVAWLEQTGRGNNPVARQDAATSTALDLLPAADRQVTVDGLLALLALKAQAGTSLGGLAAEDLVDLADDIDPHDRALYREIATLGPDAAMWAKHADTLASAAFTPAAAAASLVARHHRLGMDAVSDHALAPAALELVARIATELASADEAILPLLVAPFGDAALLAAVAAHAGEPGTAALPVLDTAAARHARRSLLAGGWEITDAAQDEGAVLPPSGAMVLVQLPCATQPGLSDSEVVDALSELEATLPSDARAIVIGPAPALCGRLPHAVQSARATVLRSGRVRAIVHLPAGLWPARTRQGLGMWLIGPGPDGARPRDHRTAVVDLRTSTLDEVAISDAVTDVVAAADPRVDLRARAFRFARFAVTTDLIATSGELVTAPPPPPRERNDPAALALDVATLYAQAAAPGVALTPWQVRPGEAAGRTTVPLGRLVQLGHLHLVQGNKLDRVDFSEAPGVYVHTVASLTEIEPNRSSAIDRLVLAAAYPRSRYTQPGDIVFCASPSPGAVIDAEGLSVVAAPARMLRLSPTAPAGLLPEVIVHAIRTAPRAGGWQLWPIPLLPNSQVDAARRALADITDARATAAAQLATFDSLTTRLVEALTTGSVSLVDPVRSSQMEG